MNRESICDDLSRRGGSGSKGRGGARTARAAGRRSFADRVAAARARIAARR